MPFTSVPSCSSATMAMPSGRWPMLTLFLDLARPYAVQGLEAFAEAMMEAWEGQDLSALEGPSGRPGGVCRPLHDACRQRA